MNYYNDFNQHKKSDTVKWIVAFVLIAVLMFGVAASLFIQLRPVEETTPETETSTEVVVPSGTVTDENGEELESGKIYKLASRMSFSAPTMYSTRASEGITVQATVLPEEAADKSVDWSVAFVNPDSAWATGKTATDYVTVTPESDGSTIATVECLADFGEQIVITVTSRDNPNAKAQCTADYVKRLTDTAINLFGVNIANAGSGSISSTSTAALNPVANFGYSNYTKDLTYSVPVQMNYFNGTITEGSFGSVFINIVESSEEYAALSSEDQSIIRQYFSQGGWEYTGSNNRISTSITFTEVFQSLYDYYEYVLTNLSGGKNSDFANYYKAKFFDMLATQKFAAMEISCTISGKDANNNVRFSEDYVCTITISNEVVNVLLDNEALEF